jgi:hypothetical protein
MIGKDGGMLANASTDSREEAPERQELRHLDPLRLAIGYPQHVQGVP